MLLGVSLAVLVVVATHGAVPAAPPPGFQTVGGLADRTLGPGEEATVSAPALPAQPNRLLLLGFRAVALHDGPAGAVYALAVRFNGKALGAEPGDTARLVGRDAVTGIRDDPSARSLRLFQAGSLLLMYARDVDQADGMGTAGRGATFWFDLTDLARAGAPNDLVFRNMLPPGGKDSGRVALGSVVVGWAEPGSLPAPPFEVPRRGPVERSVGDAGPRLFQARGGGFAVRVGNGPMLRVETALAVARSSAPDLRADDQAPSGRADRIRVEPLGTAGFRVRAAWPGLALRRTLELKDGRVAWADEWSNTGKENVGVPFGHRVFLDEGPVETWISGDRHSGWLEACSANPTLFLGPWGRPGGGFGITAESDWLRLLTQLRAYGGVGEVFTRTLALGPGKSIRLESTIEPVPDGGYWGFVNALRRRWKLDGGTASHPFFWSYREAPGAASREERAWLSLGHLGPIQVGIGPWLGLGFDARVVRAGHEPTRPPGAAPTPGPSPSLDVDAYLTRAAREPVWRAFASDLDVLRRACPQVRPVQWSHMAMEVVYGPVQRRWPYAPDLIVGPDGKPFEHAGFTKIWLGDRVREGWSVLYYAPTPGSRLLTDFLADVRRSLVDCGTAGLYVDEFSWAYRTRGYSRYGYAGWDGYSADLDADGRVLRLKTDNAATTIRSQAEVADAVLRLGKPVIANGGAAVRGGNDLAIARLVEGGNGLLTLSDAHLNRVPLVLGNFGDQTSRAGVFAAVKACLARGCLYSPVAVNLLLTGSDNFVCKLYPITVREIGPGRIVGAQRLVTTVSGAHPWPGRPGQVRIYRYDAGGGLLDGSSAVVPTQGEVQLDVPPDGLAIAELSR